MTQSEFVGSSMRDAFDKAKKTLGEDAYIIKSEQTEKGVRIFAQKSEDMPFLSTQGSKTATAVDIKCIPILTKDIKKIDNNISNQTDPITLIKHIVSICDKHNLGAAFCDAWIDHLSKNFSNTNDIIEETFSKLITFNPVWIHTLKSETPVTLVGPQGSGKTALLGKLAVALKSLGHNLRAITLDEKAGSFEQLKTYMDALEVPVQRGMHNFLIEKDLSIKNGQILLVDTPGINILQKDGQEYLFSLSEQIKTPLTLVLPNDMADELKTEIATEFAEYNAQYLIGTRFDINKRYGAFFNCAHTNRLTPVLYSNTPAISTPPEILSTESAISLLEG